MRALRTPARRTALRAGAGVLLLVAATTACAPSVAVRTVNETAVQPAYMRTFAVRPAATPAGSADPMLQNAIVDRVLRDDVRGDFARVGYAEVDPAAGERPDLYVVYRSAEHEGRETTSYVVSEPVYGWYRWGWYGERRVTSSRPVERGTVVVDVLDGGSHRLLWRGEGRVELTGDVAKDEALLGKALAQVVQRFPHRA